MDNEFCRWYIENKDSDSLHESYQEYINEMKAMGYTPSSFRKWAEETWTFINVY